MTSHVSGTQPGAAAHSSAKSGLGSGWLVFAGVLMIFGGFMTLFAGIAAIANDEVFVATRNYVYQFDLTGWGWIHLILGIVIVLAGFALFTGAAWARVVGVVLAGLGMVANFMWLPYAPLWAIVLIAVDGFVIWALCAAPSPSES
ncbi:hypothetical protein OG883_13615 [Streptomyces sp. NBC_01142]|uniref:DUF7144 family membrane protein n=1 Tax=Streptomyces sp. NBC_01142 TaxID=2975865 RepID=UPI00225B57A4|nr:hypothetical protein [Streptomyces sp. NBC_01142]MCX4820928.1 hypothetical protein [Streptomyces sp. NBC_01142]